MKKHLTEIQKKRLSEAVKQKESKVIERTLIQKS